MTKRESSSLRAQPLKKSHNREHCCKVSVIGTSEKVRSELGAGCTMSVIKILEKARSETGEMENAT